MAGAGCGCVVEGGRKVIRTTPRPGCWAASGKMADLVDQLLSSSYQTLTDTKGPSQIDTDEPV